MSKDVAEEYASSLADLTVNSKPLINMLTMLAEDYIQHAPSIVMAVEAHLQKVRGEVKLPALYLIDSIVKNVGKTYIQLFTQNIVSTFCSVFEKVDEKIRAQMFKLRQTWNDYFPPKKLYALDARVHAIDPAWPITAPAPSSTSIHVNPKFLQATTPSPPDPATPINMSDGVMREQLLKKQKELLELQKRKVELELLQTKAILEEQQKKLEHQTINLKPVDSIAKSTHSGSKGEPVVQFHNRTNEAVAPHPGHFNPHVPPPKVEGASSIGVSNIGRHPVTNNGPGGMMTSHSNLQPGNDAIPVNQPAVKLFECNTNDGRNENRLSLAVRSRDPRIIRRKERHFEKKLPSKLERVGSLPPLPEPSEMFDNLISPDTTASVFVGTKPKKESKKKKNSLKRKPKASSGNELKDAVNFERNAGQILFQNEEISKGEKRTKTEKETKSSSDKPKNTYIVKKQTKHNSLEKVNSEVVNKPTSSVNLQSSIDTISKKLKHTKDIKVLPDFPLLTNDEPATKIENICPLQMNNNNGTHSNQTDVVKLEKRKLVNPESNSDSKKLCSTDITVDLIAEVKASPLLMSPTTNIKTKHASIARLQKYNRDSPEISSPLSTSSISTSKSDDTSDKDVDLRLLPSPTASKRSSDSDSPTPKKSKAEMIDILFGNEDVDLRTLTPHPPTPPPPPIISESLELPEKALSEKSWAIFKRTKSEGKSEEKKSKGKIDRLGRVLFHHKKGEEQEDERESEDCSNANCNLIIQQYEMELSKGNITFNQYNRMLKEVISINEEMKLKEAQRKDELESSDLNQIAKSVTESDSPEKGESPEQKDMKEDQISSTSGGTEATNDEWVGENENWEKAPVNEDRSTERERFHSDVHNRPHDSHLEVEARKFVEHNHFQSQNFHRPIESERSNYTGHFDANMSKSIHPPLRPWMMNLPPPPIGVQPPNMLPVHPNEIGKFSRWPLPGHQRPVFNEHPQYYPSSRSMHSKPRYSHHREPRDVPPADPLVLDLIAHDTMHTINIDGVPREVRFYGEVAVIMFSWDDPREITFQPGSRRIIIDELDALVLVFNHPYREFLIDGKRIKMRLGAPTRELYVDGQFYEVIFGGPPLQIMLGNRLHTIKLEGPSPQVRIGTMKRTDLVAGRINLIVDAKHMFALFLDAKPQRFDIDGIPYILRFVEALRTIVINGRPFKIEFGGLPVPIFFRGIKHYLRLSVLPHGIKPGHITIVNMEGGRLPTPPPSPPSPIITNAIKPRIEERYTPGVREMSTPNIPDAPSPMATVQHAYSTPQAGNEQPLELLTSLMPTAMAPSTGQSYTVEQSSEDSSAPPQNSLINVGELYQKLVAIGIVPAATKDKEHPVEDPETMRPVDFSQPETLKIKQPGLIKRLYTGIQCSSCGVRFSPEETVKYSQHLDWHFRQNRRDRDSTKIAQSRKWYYDVSDWIQYQEIEDLEERAQSWFEAQDTKSPTIKEDIPEEEPSVVAGDKADNIACIICQDKFEQFYNEEKEEWHLRRAIRIDDKVYHPLCYQDYKESENRRANLELQEQEPENIKKTDIEELETIDLDDTFNDAMNDAIITVMNNAVTDAVNDAVNDAENYAENYAENDAVNDAVNDEVNVGMNDVVNDGLNDTLNEIVEITPIVEGSVIDDNQSQESGNEDPFFLPEIEDMPLAIDEEPCDTDEKSAVESKDSQEKNVNLSTEEEDDDILQVEVLERKIESYEILDDDDEEDEQLGDKRLEGDETDKIDEDDKELDDMDEIDYTKVTIKTEKLDLPEPIVDTTHTSVTATIDGNVEFEEAPPPIVPGRIKINISKAIPIRLNKDSKLKDQQQSDHFRMPPSLSEQASVLAIVEQNQPPPPGEELCPARLKPRLVGTKLVEVPTAHKGNELSGLCSIM